MGIAGGPYIVRDSSLILELDAADRNSYVSGSLVWRDLSANSYSGSLTNGPIFSSGSGGSVIGDGIDDFVDLVEFSSGSATTSFSFGGWFKTVAGGTNLPCVRGADAFGNGWSCAILWDYINFKVSANVVTTSAGATLYAASGSSVTPADTWVHAFGVWNAGVGVTVYINGVAEATTNTTTTQLRTSTKGWLVGRISNSVYGKFNLANMQVYNRVLSATEILQNYNALKSRFNL